MDEKSRFKDRRKELRLTLKEVANMVGVNYTTILRWESGEISSMRIDKVVLYAKALQVTPSWIMGVKNNQIIKTDEMIEEEKNNLISHIYDRMVKLNLDELSVFFNLIDIMNGLSSSDFDTILDYIKFIKSKK